MSNDWIKNIVILVLLVLLGLFGYLGNRADNKLQEQEDMVAAMNDTLDTWIDKDGVSRARIQAIETARTKDFLKATTTDSLIMALQVQVKKFSKELKKGGNVTYVQTEFRIDTVFTDRIKIVGETVVEGLTYPIYHRDFKLIDKGKTWVEGDITMGIDSLFLKQKILNEYSVVIGREKKKGLKILFKKPKPFVDVSNFNPYSTTKSVRTYKVTDQKGSKFSLGTYGGYGFTRNKDGTISSGFQAGVGVLFKLVF